MAAPAAQYRLFVPHYLGQQFFDADTTVTEGREIPTAWAPSLGCDPLNDTAVQKFWDQGPRSAGGCEPGISPGQNWNYDAPPVTYWTSVPGSQLASCVFSPALARASALELNQRRNRKWQSSSALAAAAANS